MFAVVAAQETTLRALLEGAHQYVVPLYQRPYQWGSNQLETLWGDVLELAEDRLSGHRSTHFIGSLVLAPTTAHVAGSVTSHLVVDGQQRLTTLTLLLAAIRDFRKAMDPEGFGHEEIQESYLVNKFKRGAEHFKLVPTQKDRESYRSIITSGAERAGTDNIGTAYRFFRSQLERLNDPSTTIDIESIQEAVADGLALVSISTHPEDNVHRIFQSLNNTGLTLTQGDLLRNYIFMRLPKRGEEVYEKYWLPLQRTLTNEQLENLFWIDLAKKHPIAKLGDTFLYQQRKLDSLETEDQIADEVARFARIARLYQLVLNPELEEDSGVRFRLQRLQEWDASVVHPISLELLVQRQIGNATNETLARALHVIESYLVRRFLAGRATQGLNRTFREATSSFNPNVDVDVHLNRWLASGRRHFYSDETVRESIRLSPYYLQGRQAHRRLLLRWLEVEFGSKEPIDTSKLSIEHVMPQTLSPEWRKQLDAIYPNEDIDALHESLVHTLGNLTLTGYNSTLSNRPFDWKKAELIRSGLRLSASVTQQESWSAEQIIARGDTLSDLILSAWPGPTDTAPTDSEDNPLWIRLRQVLASLPYGSWTSYGDLAALIGTAAQPVGNYIATTTAPNAYRVLRRDGKVSEAFQWLTPEHKGLTPKDVLESEGILFDSLDRASQAQRLNVDDLVRLVDGEQDGEQNNT